MTPLAFVNLLHHELTDSLAKNDQAHRNGIIYTGVDIRMQSSHSQNLKSPGILDIKI